MESMAFPIQASKIQIERAGAPVDIVHSRDGSKNGCNGLQFERLSLHRAGAMHFAQ
jgi:hypothetical protein